MALLSPFKACRALENSLRPLLVSLKMATQSAVNDLAMQGEGAYNAHSELQYEAMLKALPLLAKAAKETEKKYCPGQTPLTVAEYGSSQGKNSIEPLKTLYKAFSLCQLQIQLNDRPGNDFNTLSTTIAEWTDSLTEPSRSPFVSMVPGSFYRQILPAQSVHLGFSFTCLQHLEKTPQTLDENLLPVPNALELFQAQSHSDFCTFLRHREKEILPGGCLVLCFPIVGSAKRENLAAPVTALGTAGIEMIQEGVMCKEVAGAFQKPAHDRSMEEVLRSLDAKGDGWIVRDLFEDSVVHPAIEELRTDQKKNGPTEEASAKYADALIDWIVAVVASGFLKAIKVGEPGCTDERAEEIFAEWVRRAKRVCLRDHRDQEAFLSFVYIWLQRSNE